MVCPSSLIATLAPMNVSSAPADGRAARGIVTATAPRSPRRPAPASRVQRALFLCICLIALLAGGAPSGGRAQGAGAGRPNIVIIVADDLGYGDLGSYGATRVRTPNLDRLAAEGMRFTDAHAPAGVCIPSRYGLLTGRYPFRTEAHPDRGPVIEQGRMTIASLLKAHGYTTGLVGKWHLGFEGGANFDYTRPLRGGPVDRGFDSFFGIHASTDIPPYFYIRDDRVVAAPTEEIEAGSTPGWSKIQGEFWRAGKIAPDLKLEDVMPRFVREAVTWLEQKTTGANPKPFFLQVCFTAPHTPWLPVEAFRGSPVGLYGDFLGQVDGSVGQILAALAKAGVADNTLVLFTSDNGPVWYPEDTQRLGHASAGNLRGMKGDAWEGGHRIPFIVRWPGRTPAGSVNATTFSFVDLLATLAELTGAPLPRDAGEDSFSVLPAFLGHTSQPRPPVVALSSRKTLSLRDGNWKYIPALGSGGFSAPSVERPIEGGPTGQLYDLAKDPREQTNLWQQEPEVVARLKAQLNDYVTAGRTRP